MLATNANKYAIIFDFDGTILDTEMAEFLAWNDIYNQFDISLERSLWEQRIGLVGENSFNPLTHLQTIVKETIDIFSLQQKRRSILREYVLSLKPRSGVLELIEAAQENNISLGIASSSPSKWVKSNLSQMGIADVFSTIKCADDVRFVKPDPELYICALKDMGVSPKLSIAIEDSPPGLLSAKRAGMSCVCVPCELSRTLDFALADVVFESLAEFSIEAASHLSLW
ncbi:phosphorylated carbohydrates phosphatase [Clostridium homopropionicum DSM 5847]|uniref:Phosphorylated carbohydrates phosphatase n=1 Tax=Clostridium homopropionicum DSM 5847 TaxID=1121318 RepID=A0A0L6Z7H1_9CLOT|nr:HAD-IA family hydrolase [Clostridium homopropionicum]KOA18743.1 phosphorylated carbohydrates phosphatase [Clostridium homopropionicum DSM 5847]SFG54562.1 haloacid dehalogenase superfamily, subfamily IA, variant 3 with third motif having DD or ED [Clostridium homopropionicum]